MTAEEIAARLAFYERATRDAAEALAAPDPDLDAERWLMAQPLTKEPRK